MRIFAWLLLIVSALAWAEPAVQADSSVLQKALESNAKLTSNEDEFLPVDQAFKVSFRNENNKVSVDFVPAEGYYLYRERLNFGLKNPADGSLGPVSLPKGDVKQDPSFGKVEVYHHPFQAAFDLKPIVAEGAADLQIGYQGCSEKGLCYPPQKKIFKVNFSGISTANSSAPAIASATPSVKSVTTPMSETDEVAGLFKNKSFIVLLASFFVLGLGLSFTPCVFPMIPILSGIIVGQGANSTRMHTFLLSVAYVMGMAITYSAAGVAAGMTGSLISNALQNPWVLGTFALVFVALSFSMFGFYELQLPGFLQSKLSDTSNNLKGGKFTGVFIMGALSALIVGPCVAAPLAGALLYISKTQDVVLGGSALFAMSLGMGVPLLLIGASAGTLLPRAGMWMEAVKKFFGVLLLGVAIWLISPVIPPVAHMLLWAALLIISAMYLSAIDPLPADVSGWHRLWKGAGVIALLAGVALVIGALSGGRDVLQPLAGFKASGGAGALVANTGLKFDRVANVAALDTRIKQAAGKTVMLDFYADWCVSCKEMEHDTFVDKNVQAQLKDTVLLQADVTANNDDDKALLKRFGLFGPPGIIFFDGNGNELKGRQVVGYQAPEKFIASLDRVYASASPSLAKSAAPIDEKNCTVQTC
ncbi:MAG: protein-disulfide reductase DsbD [Burkholderiales bacterium]